MDWNADDYTQKIHLVQRIEALEEKISNTIFQLEQRIKELETEVDDYKTKIALMDMDQAINEGYDL